MERQYRSNESERGIERARQQEPGSSVHKRIPQQYLKKETRGDLLSTLTPCYQQYRLQMTQLSTGRERICLLSV